LSISEAANRIGVSRQGLHAVLSGEVAVTVELALRFARLTGGAAELYLQMQARRDLWQAEERLRDSLAANRQA
jgi:addiction module HigA family antidote